MSRRKVILYYCLYLVVLVASMKVSTLSCTAQPASQATEAIKHIQLTTSETEAKAQEQVVAAE